jgi:hypothetical protein
LRKRIKWWKKKGQEKKKRWKMKRKGGDNVSHPKKIVVCNQFLQSLFSCKWQNSHKWHFLIMKIIYKR